MPELFPASERADSVGLGDGAQDFITVFEEVNKIFARQTDSRLDVADISAQPLVSRSDSSKASPAIFLTLYLLARYIVPYLV